MESGDLRNRILRIMIFANVRLLSVIVKHIENDQEGDVIISEEYELGPVEYRQSVCSGLLG